jgi:choline/glycine/proline betaine transport protein
LESLPNFIYEVRLRGYNSPAFAMAAMDNDEQQVEQHRYYRAEVYLKEGGQNYDDGLESGTAD